MDMQKIRAAAQAIRANVVRDFHTLANRDRLKLEAVARELGMEINEPNLAQISAELAAANISLADEFPKAKYRALPAPADKPLQPEAPIPYEVRIVDRAEDESALPSDGEPWTDAPPLNEVAAKAAETAAAEVDAAKAKAATPPAPGTLADYQNYALQVGASNAPDIFKITVARAVNDADAVALSGHEPDLAALHLTILDAANRAGMGKPPYPTIAIP